MKKLAMRRIAGMVTVGLLIGAIAISSAPALATLVEPVLIEGNPSCPSGTTQLTKVEPVVSGSLGVTQNGDTYTLSWSVDAPYISFSTTNGLLVQAVVVKGGDNANLFDYRSLGGTTSDSGLHAPLNPSNGKFYGLSHVSFCWDTSQVTTTTTEPTTATTEPTTVTTQATTTSISTATTEPTTTSSAPSTTVAPTTTSAPTTTVAPATSSTTTTEPATEASTTSTTTKIVSPSTTVGNTSDTLPFTGFGSNQLAAVSLLALALGSALVYLTRHGEGARHLDRS